jgi:hypothetical protein
MLYETSGRAEEILGVNIEDLDFAGRRCPVKAKGARTKARHCGRPARTTCRRPCTGMPDAGTARLLPRLLRGCIRGDSVRHSPPARPWQGRQLA